MNVVYDALKRARLIKQGSMQDSDISEVMSGGADDVGALPLGQVTGKSISAEDATVINRGQVMPDAMNSR